MAGQNLNLSAKASQSPATRAANAKRLKTAKNLPPTQDSTALPANANTTVTFGAVDIRNLKVAGLEQVLTYPHPAI